MQSEEEQKDELKDSIQDEKRTSIVDGNTSFISENIEYRSVVKVK